MHHSPLGRSDLSVSSIGLGCVTFGREIDEGQAFAIMDRAVERGINLFDTAASYADGGSEEIVGRWIRSRGARDQVVVATKVNGDFGGANITGSIDRSLKRLGVEQIDLFQLHHWIAEHESLEQVLEALERAVSSQKARFICASNIPAAGLREALRLQTQHGWSRFQAIQPPYSLVQREIENQTLPLCAAERIGVISYSPLAAGFLSGKYLPGGPIPKGTRFDVKPGHQTIYFTPANFKLLARLQTVAQRHAIALPELALAWVLRRPGITSMLIGARSVDQVDQAFRADRLNFPDAIINEISSGLPCPSPGTPGEVG